jgi:NAD-dependent DNA ligase
MIEESEMCGCGKFKDQISNCCSYPHPVPWIDWAKEREERKKDMTELDRLREWAFNGCDEEKWIPGLTISESILKYIEALEKKLKELDNEVDGLSRQIVFGHD